MNYSTSIFKIGGKILENYENIKSTISQLTQLYEKNVFNKIILVPGGGSYANFIREMQTTLNLDEDLAHWMGILSMDYNGKKLFKRFKNLDLTDDFKVLREFKKGFYLFLPFMYLKKIDELPHNWDVTSDSITLFLAKKMKLDNCFLIKDVDGIFDTSNKLIRQIDTVQFKELRKSGKLAQLNIKSNNLKNRSKPIDYYLTQLIELFNISCFILNGSSNVYRILDFFDDSVNEKKKFYTKILRKKYYN